MVSLQPTDIDTEPVEDEPAYDQPPIHQLPTSGQTANNVLYSTAEKVLRCGKASKRAARLDYKFCIQTGGNVNYLHRRTKYLEPASMR